MSVLESYVNIEFSNYYDLHNYTINICNHKLTLNNNYSREIVSCFEYCNFAVIKLFKLFFFFWKQKFTSVYHIFLITFTAI